MSSGFIYCRYKNRNDNKIYECLVQTKESKVINKTDDFELGTLLFNTFEFLVNIDDMLETKEITNEKPIDDVFTQFLLNKFELLEENVILLNFVNYIKLCLENCKNCSTESLSIFCATIVFPLKFGNSIIVNSDINFDNKPLSIQQIQNALDSAVSPGKGELFYERKNMNAPIVNELVNVYVIDTMADILSASLNEIFKAKLVIKQCKFCNRFFIPFSHRKNSLYCEEIRSENNGKTCYQMNNIRNQAIRIKNSKSALEHDKIRISFKRKVNSTKLPSEDDILSDEYEDFLKKSKKWKKQVESDSMSEEEYINLMKSYWEDVKKRAKQRKRENRH